MFKGKGKKPDFDPDLSKVTLKRELTTEEQQFLKMLLEYTHEPLSERTLDGCCLPASMDIEIFLSRVAEEYGLTPHELSDTIKTAMFALFRKYTIINIEVNKQAFKHEMK
tara:strand:+ start:3984 stop:4313 length:330 start_codon:yes stop_codon:yes gene_type:complete